MSMWWTTKKVALVFPCLIALGAGLGCSDGAANNGTGGAGGTPSTGGMGGTGGTEAVGGSGGTGGVPVDTMTDPKNCGAIDNVCAPGQTCAGGVCTCGASSVAFSAVQVILTAKCATGGCHSGAAPKSSLDLSSASAYAALVDVPAKQCADGRMRVKPGDPSNSYIIDKALNVDKCSGNRMPPSVALPLDSVQTISDWICGGAMP